MVVGVVEQQRRIITSALVDGEAERPLPCLTARAQLRRVAAQRVQQQNWWEAFENVRLKMLFQTCTQTICLSA